MVEVFKTNVSNCDDANRLITHIHQNFQNYKANFDLEDCDLILRVQAMEGSINSRAIIFLLEKNGFSATILEDDFEPSIGFLSRR